MREIILSSNEPAKKLENFLKRQFPIGYIRKLFRKNGVRINGRRAKQDDLIHAGDRIQLYIPFETTKQVAAPSTSRAKIEIVFEDDALLVINKPAGLAVHEGRTVTKRGSIVGTLESRYRDSTIKPQLVHRLDKDTSGLLMIAKNQSTADEMMSIFESGDVTKEYLAPRRWPAPVA